MHQQTQNCSVISRALCVTLQNKPNRDSNALEEAFTKYFVQLHIILSHILYSVQTFTRKEKTQLIQKRKYGFAQCKCASICIVLCLYQWGHSGQPAENCSRDVPVASKTRQLPSLPAPFPTHFLLETSSIRFVTSLPLHTSSRADSLQEYLKTHVSAKQALNYDSTVWIVSKAYNCPFSQIRIEAGADNFLRSTPPPLHLWRPLCTQTQ